MERRHGQRGFTCSGALVAAELEGVRNPIGMW